MFDEPTICLVGFDDKRLDYVRGWDGFISPDGLFYKVVERDSLESVHDLFAESFSDMILKTNLRDLYKKIQIAKPEFKSINLSYKDMLINVLGYVNYEHMGDRLEVTPPNPRINGKKVTNEQIDMIARLIRLNGDNTNDLNQIFEYDRRNNTYEVSQVKRI